MLGQVLKPVKQSFLMSTSIKTTYIYSKPPNTGPSGIQMVIFRTFWVRLSNGPVFEWFVLQYLSRLFLLA
jgi:hypothetical protein